MKEITVRDLFEAGAHFGHKSSIWNPKVEEYIFGEKAKIHIINLDKTLELIDKTAQFLAQHHLAGNRILFVGTKYISRNIIKEQASRLGQPYINRRWLGGTLTNYKTIRMSVKKMLNFIQQKEEGAFSSLTKRELLMKDREIAKKEETLGGLKDLKGLPDILFIVDVGFEHIAIDEAKKLGIPVAGIVDTNTDPELADYPIVANDDSTKTIELILSYLVDRCLAAKENMAYVNAKDD